MIYDLFLGFSILPGSMLRSHREKLTYVACTDYIGQILSFEQEFDLSVAAFRITEIIE